MKKFRTGDSLFKLVFASPEFPEHSLSLYNALLQYGDDLLPVSGAHRSSEHLIPVSADTPVSLRIYDNVIYLTSHRGPVLPVFTKLVQPSYEQTCSGHHTFFFRPYNFGSSNYSPGPDAFFREVQLHLDTYRSQTAAPAAAVIGFYVGRAGDPAVIMRQPQALLINLLHPDNSMLLASCPIISDYCKVLMLMKEYIAIGRPLLLAAKHTCKDCAAMGILKSVFGLHYLEIFRLLLNEFESVYLDEFASAGVHAGSISLHTAASCDYADDLAGLDDW